MADKGTLGVIIVGVLALAWLAWWSLGESVEKPQPGQSTTEAKPMYTIRTKSGGHARGRLVEDRWTELVLDTPNGMVTVKKSEIESTTISKY